MKPNPPPLAERDTIYSTGVFLQPMKCIIDGEEQWRWVAVCFEDDSFMDGDVISPVEYASRIKDLLEPAI